MSQVFEQHMGRGPSAHEGDGVEDSPSVADLTDYTSSSGRGDSSSGPLDDIKSGLKLLANISLTVGSGMDEISARLDRLSRNLQRNTPINFASVASGVFVTGVPLVLSFGSPDQGTYWEVASVAVGGTDAQVVAAGSAGLYVGALLGVAGGTMVNLADRASTLPNTAFYGTRQVVVNDQEFFYLIITNDTNGQTYAANAQLTVYNVTAAQGRTVGTT